MPQHPPYLSVRRGPIGEEHHPELADHHVERLIVERQRLGVGDLPDDVGGALGAGCAEFFGDGAHPGTPVINGDFKSGTAAASRPASAFSDTRSSASEADQHEVKQIGLRR